MTEPPSAWGPLEHAIDAVSALDPAAQWQALVARGLVVDAPGRLQQFAQLKRQAAQECNKPGPTPTFRLAGLIRAAGWCAP